MHGDAARRNAKPHITVLFWTIVNRKTNSVEEDSEGSCRSTGPRASPKPVDQQNSPGANRRGFVFSSDRG
jgi:hypothetical protein